MPLSAVCVSAVGGHHKAWPSQGSLLTEDAKDFLTMNNSEEICTYRGNSHNNFSQQKKAAYFEYDISDDKPAKKEKKWSFGNLFRRKKKTNDSSSDDESKDKIKRKSEKKKKPITFDHIVVTPSQVKPVEARKEDIDKTNVISQSVSSQSKSSTFESLYKHQAAVQYQQTRVKSKTSLDNWCKKSWKDLTKVRAEARRTSLNRNSSSDEDSQKSNSSQKFRSDDSLYKTRDSSCSRKSRAARTERYLKRHSRDGENPNNYLRISKSDAESTFLRVSDDSNRSPSASPQMYKSSFSSLSSQTTSGMGLSTIPPSHTHYGRFRVSNSTSNPSYKPPVSMNEYRGPATLYTPQRSNVMFNNQRSISFDADIHRPHETSEVIYAKLELGKPENVDKLQLRRHHNVYQPPAPPPRDPKRLHGSLVLDTLNHNNFCDISSTSRYNFINDGSLKHVRKMNMANRPAYKSSSENHIPSETPIILSQRPSSTTPVTTSSNRPDNYQYLTDKQPRSRKPIFIQNDPKKCRNSKDITSGDQMDASKDTNSFLEQLQAKKSIRYSRGSSPQIFTCEAKVETEIFLPSVLPSNTLENKESHSNGNDVRLNQKNLDLVNQNSVEEESSKNKSTNLEEALNELEAIYNSLKLGDENLIEMAEQREKEVATQQMLESKTKYHNYNGHREAFSDSNFSYEPFDSLDSRRRRRFSRKSLRSDDMAFRKLHKPERAATITDPQAVSYKISYLSNSPVYKEQNFHGIYDPNEPDITLDDVVYRNIKQSNKSKVPEHPPPFGIPLGPITLAANSDYLHAVPDTETTKTSRTPDLIKDDLAFRNLRKDNNKEAALPPVSSEDFRNNNFACSASSPPTTHCVDLSELKKNRAVRSKSANIGSLISQEVIDRASRRNARDKNSEYKTLTDIADVMQIARQVLKDKDKKFNDTKAGFSSDCETAYSKYIRFHPMSRKNIEVDVEPEVKTEKLEENSEINQMLSSLSKDMGSAEIQKHLVKESTPDPISPFEDGKLAPLFKTDSFEDVLTALAIEAKRASDKFTQELEELDAKKVSGEMLPETVESSISKSDKNDEEGAVLESVATIVFSKQEDKLAEPDHDYENVGSDEEMIMKLEEKATFVGTIANTEELKKRGIEEKLENKECNIEILDKESQSSPGEECVHVVSSNASSVNVPSGMSSSNLYSPNSCDFDDHSHANYVHEKSFPRIESAHKLKSPKLVLETSKLNKCHDSSYRAISEVPCNSTSAPSSQNFLDSNDHKTICFFDNSPESLAIACSYGIACLYQLAALDLFTILGIILAVFTFIATLIF